MPILERIKALLTPGAPAGDGLEAKFARLLEMHEQDLQQRQQERQEWQQERQERQQERRQERRQRRQERKEWNKKWGELANKMGTLAEDIVAPSVRRVIRIISGPLEPGRPLDFFAVRVDKPYLAARGASREFDVVAVLRDQVLIGETKSSLGPKDVDDLVELMCHIRDYFPEWKDKQFAAAIASLYVHPSVVQYAERKGLLVLGMGDELAEVLNSAEFQPRQF